MEAQRLQDQQIEELRVAIKAELEDEIDVDYKELMNRVTSIAVPLANRKLCKKITKLLKSACKESNMVLRGSKQVMRSMKKDLVGIIIMAGDTYPIDLISHIPVSCEERNIPYCYIPSGIMISRAMECSGSTSCVIILPDDKYIKIYEKVENKIKELSIATSC